MSFLVKNNEVIAISKETIKSGTVVNYSYTALNESINANLDKVLVNSTSALISNAKKYNNTDNMLLPLAIKINNSNDFLLID